MRNPRQYDSDVPDENEWVCEVCGTINNLDWAYCDQCGCDQDGNALLDEEDDEEDEE